MKKINFIFGFKKSIFFFIPLLITSCGINLKSTDGSTINFKRENVFCKFDDYWYEKKISFTRKGDVYLLAKNYRCRANGVRTYLNGIRENFSDEAICEIFVKNAKGKWYSSFELYPIPKNSFACTAMFELNPGCRLMNHITRTCVADIPPELSWDDSTDFMSNLASDPITPR